MSDHHVQISPQQMYAILVEVRDTVRGLAASHAGQERRIDDHEKRLRDLEQSEVNTRRIEDMEDDVRAIRADLDSMKKRLYAIPGASVIIAGVAVVVTLIRTF